MEYFKIEKTKNEIIEKLISDDNLQNYAKHLTKGNLLYKDLFQEMLLILYEKDFNKLKEIKNLKGYSAMIMRILWINKNSIFHKKYGNEYSFDNINQLPFNYHSSSSYKRPSHLRNKELFNKMISKAIYLSKNGKLKEATEARAFLMYVNAGSYGKLSKQIGIPRDVIAKYIQNFKKKQIHND